MARERQVNIRMSAEEYEAIRAMAYLDRTTVSAFMRDAVASMVSTFRAFQPAVEAAQGGQHDQALELVRQAAEQVAREVVEVQQERANREESA